MLMLEVQSLFWQNQNPLLLIKKSCIYPKKDIGCVEIKNIGCV